MSSICMNNPPHIIVAPRWVTVFPSSPHMREAKKEVITSPSEDAF